MKRLSGKAILVGLVLVALISVSLSFLWGYYVVDIYNSVVAKNQGLAPSEIANRLAFHPLSITFAVLATVLGFGVPGYVTAVIANKFFVLNSFLVGLLGSSVALLDIEGIAAAPWFAAATALASILVATGAGKLRELQVKTNKM